jgi:ribulose-phosphate 3-epimerase
MSEERPSPSPRAARLGRLDAAPRPFVTPSLLDCDFARMTEELEALEQAGAVAVHLDVMDGHFVPNLSYGPPVIDDWRKWTDFPFDTHLMISDPSRYLDDFVRAGCDVIIFHIEAVPEPRPLLRRIRAAGCQAALALNPPTPFSAIEPYLDEMDALLVMSVMPGFGGQAFEAAVLDKVRAARAARPDLRISIDGGIKPDTAEEAAAAGVSQLVAGSAVFRIPGKYATALAELADGARRGSERGGGSAPKAESPALE